MGYQKVIDSPIDPNYPNGYLLIDSVKFKISNENTVTINGTEYLIKNMIKTMVYSEKTISQLKLPSI